MTTNLQTERTKARILQSIQQEKNGCWFWLGGHVRNQARNTSYPYVEQDGKRISVRRLVYQLYGNTPELGDHIIISTCNNPECVNPDHLVRSEQIKSRGPPRGKRL